MRFIWLAQVIQSVQGTLLHSGHLAEVSAQSLTTVVCALQLFRAMRQHQRFGSSSGGSGAELADLAALNSNGIEDGVTPSSPSANSLLDQTRHRSQTKGARSWPCTTCSRWKPRCHATLPD